MRKMMPVVSFLFLTVSAVQVAASAQPACFTDKDSYQERLPSLPRFFKATDQRVRFSYICAAEFFGSPCQETGSMSFVFNSQKQIELSGDWKKCAGIVLRGSEAVKEVCVYRNNTFVIKYRNDTQDTGTYNDRTMQMTIQKDSWSRCQITRQNPPAPEPPVQIAQKPVRPVERQPTAEFQTGVMRIYPAHKELAVPDYSFIYQGDPRSCWWSVQGGSACDVNNVSEIYRGFPHAVGTGN